MCYGIKKGSRRSDGFFLTATAMPVRALQSIKSADPSAANTDSGIMKNARMTVSSAEKRERKRNRKPRVVAAGNKADTRA